MRRAKQRRFQFVGVWLTTLALATAGTVRADDPPKSDDLYKLNLEQLLTIEIKSAAGLTETDSRRVPVALTELTARDIEKSGVVDLNRLFEIEIPNGQFIDHHHLQPHVGFRGIISDREDKYLFQVNGRTMNNRMLMGADNERAIPLLGDIKAVNVVRGPASATHGAGAVAGVIGLETYTGLTFQGFEVKARQGVVEQFTGGEVRYGKKFNDKAGLFAYYGAADQPGASSDSASYYIGRSYPAANGLPANVAGTPSSIALNDYWASSFDSPRQKAHVSLVNGPFEIWARFVQDGHQDRPLREIYNTAKPATLSVNDWIRGRQFRNRQTTVAATFKKDLSPTLRLNIMESFDRWSLKDQRMGTQTNAPVPREGGESEFFSRAIATWTPNQTHSVAFGAEYSRESFDDPYYSDALDRAPIINDREWTTDTYSVLAEYQAKLNKEWTLFASARTDKHTYSDWLFSPRGTLVFTPTDKDTIKAMVGKSVRRGGDEELWAEHVRKDSIPDPESLLSYELSYERKVSDRLRIGANGFYEDYDAIGWVPALYLSSSIGKYQMAGGELLLTYVTPRTRVTFSSGITKLVDADVPASLPAGGQAITAKPYGYGNDLAEWAPLVTKATLVHDVTDRFSATASVAHYSGFPGAQDFADYAATLKVVPSAMPYSDADYTEPYGPNLFLNIGAEYRPTPKVTLRLDGYNLAAIADETLSKRNYYFRLSEFNVQPASLGISVRYRF